VLGLLIISNSFWTLIANNKRLPQKLLVLATLFLVAISGIMLFNGASINMINNINQAQAQAQEAQALSYLSSAGAITALRHCQLKLRV
jgi:flagellar basal body-associated protein FliL